MITIITVYSHNFIVVAPVKIFLHAKKLNFTLTGWPDAWAPHANYIENNHMKVLFVIIFCRSEQKEP